MDSSRRLSDLPLPPHYRRAHAEEWDYNPDQAALFEAAQRWRREHDIAPAGSDAADVHLLIIDAQKDFCFPGGALYVGGRSGRGAVGDTARLSELIYRNLPLLTNVTATMDTHLAYQIFFASFWRDASGEPVPAHRTITTGDIVAGRVAPNPDVAWWLCRGDAGWLRRQVEHYCRELERAGKYELYLWPPHCIVGSDGHALAGVVHEARMFHAYARGSQSWTELKGDDPLTENYSALRPEVTTRFDGVATERPDRRLLVRLLSADALIVAGEASSHCVKSTVDDLLEEIASRDPSLASKVYLLSDCMSAVAVPDGKGGFLADFTPQAEAALARYAEAGMHVVRSTDPVESWPGPLSALAAR